MDDPAERIDAFLAEIGAEVQRRGPREWAVRVPSTKRGSLAAGVACGERVVTLHAFFMRAPDRRHEAVYARLLRKQMTTYAWRFALDDHGDLFVIAQTPLEALTGDELDRLLGALSTLVDEVYEGVLREGFEVPEGTVIGSPPGED